MAPKSTSPRAGMGGNHDSATKGAETKRVNKELVTQMTAQIECQNAEIEDLKQQNKSLNEKVIAQMAVQMEDNDTRMENSKGQVKSLGDLLEVIANFQREKDERHARHIEQLKKKHQLELARMKERYGSQISELNDEQERLDAYLEFRKRSRKLQKLSATDFGGRVEDLN